MLPGTPRATGVRTVTADIAISGGPCIAGGVIVPRGPARVEIDARGLDILPGFIDVHGDAFERAMAPRPGVMLPMGIAMAELEAQLLAAGVTTAYLAVTLSWEAGLRSGASYEMLRDAVLARPVGAVPDLRLHVRFEAHNLDCLEMVLADIKAGHVHMLSFNDHTPGILRKLPDPVAVSKMVERAGQSYEEFCADARRAGDRPLEKIEEATRLLAAAARDAGIPMASHDDAGPGERAAFRALGVTISEFPTTAEVARDAVAHGEPTVMGAPNVVRGGSHTGWHGAEALVREGSCSVLCSDYHYPSMLQSVYILARNGSAGFEDAVGLVTRNAARMARLEDRGTLGLGQRGDILLVEPGDVPRLVAVIAAGRLAYLSPDGMGRVGVL
jgi:alpha-D-ribose 1-methylphosphonate 5-triphosphate diphosphatase